MAVISGGNPFGEFRGKMGGVIFSRNKGGQYVKAYAVPVDANTSAQVQARLTFAQAVSAFHVLDPVNKGAWNVFAASYFNSKSRGNVPGIHSGVNAFVSLRNILLGMERTITPILDLEIDVNGTPATLPVRTDILANSIAPIAPMGGILDGYSIGAFSVLEFDTSTNIVRMAFPTIWNATPSAPSPAPSTNSIFNDANGKNVGFAVYASNIVPQAGVFVNNPDIVLLGNTGLVGAYTTPSVVTADVEIRFSAVADFSGYQNALQSGGVYRLQAYMYNTEGQILRVGEATVAVA